MQQTEIKQLPFPGAVDKEGIVTFTLYAPGKKRVHLIGDFNDWKTTADPLHQIVPGLWTTEKELPRGTFAYQYIIDDSLIICDPYARYVEIEAGEGAPKAIVKPKEDPFEWQHDQWEKPVYSDLIINEMHIADFTPQRDFREAIERMDHIRDLGINTIELMPIFGVEENKGWGYTPTFLFAVNRDYGTPNELRLFIDEAHGKGMAVILDITLAHTGPKHPFNLMYPYDQSPWYGKGGKENMFGLPQLDYSKQATRDFVKDVMAYWLGDFHVDGFRFDYLSGINITKENYGINTISWAAHQINENVLLIGEMLPEDPPLLLNSGMDGAWHVRFSYAIKALLCQKEMSGYDWNNLDKAIWTLDGNSEGYGKNPLMMVNYLESHDENRVIFDIINSGFNEDAARRKSALGASILFTAVGPPMLYHGQTFGQRSPKNMDHNYIQWENLATAGGGGLHEHYKKLAWFRREHKALRTANLSIDSVMRDEYCVVYRRWSDDGDEVIVAANFSPNTQKIKIHFPVKGKWKEFFSGQELEIDGSADIEIDHWAAKIFTKI